MEPLRQLFYLSRACAGLTEPDLHRILHISRRNNRRTDVTGCLLYTGRHFGQVLEGRGAALAELIDRIAADQRHTEFFIALDHPLPRRSFPDWSMGILYRLDIADRMEEILTQRPAFEESALRLLPEMRPDPVIGRL
jgi:hypothetical protein